MEEGGGGQTAWTGFGDYVEGLGKPMRGGGDGADFNAMLEAALAEEAAAARRSRPPDAPATPPRARPTAASELPTPPRGAGRAPCLLEALPPEVARRAYDYLHPLSLAVAAIASRALKRGAWDDHGRARRFPWDSETIADFGELHTSETVAWPIDEYGCALTLERHKRLHALFRGRDNDDQFYFWWNKERDRREVWPGDVMLSARLDFPICAGDVADDDVVFLVSQRDDEDDPTVQDWFVVAARDVDGWDAGAASLTFTRECGVVPRTNAVAFVQLCALILAPEPMVVFLANYTAGFFNRRRRCLQIGADPGPVVADGARREWGIDCAITRSDNDEEDYVFEFRFHSAPVEQSPRRSLETLETVFADARDAARPPSARTLLLAAFSRSPGL